MCWSVPWFFGSPSVRFEIGGFFEFVFAVHVGEESGARKIKAVDLDFVRCFVDLLSFGEAEAEEVFGLLEGLRLGGCAGALEVVETSFVAGDGADDAGFVEGGVGEGVVVWPHVCACATGARSLRMPRSNSA